MNSLIPVRRILLVSVAVAIVLALSISTQTYLSMQGHGHSMIRLFLWQLGSWLWWVALAPVVARLGGDSFDALTRRRALLIAAVCVSLVAGHVIVTALITAWIQPFGPMSRFSFLEALWLQAGSLFLGDLLIAALLLLAGWSAAGSHKARRLTLREAQLETELARAHLEALRLEIQPHFLFNTLNSIAALIRRGSNPQALEMLLGLSDLMRATLAGPHHHMVPLASELEFTTRYVDIQQHRFSDRLTVDMTVADAARAIVVPAFLLQPLVENAFRHGVAKKQGASRLEIGARLDGDRLHVWVLDSGGGLRPDFQLARDAGTGLTNVRQRLDRLYGSSASLDLRTSDAGETVADVRIPTQSTQQARATA